MLSGDVELQVGGDGGSAGGLGAGAVGLDTDEVDGEGDGDETNEVGEEEEGAGGDADDGDGGRRREGGEVVGDLGGKGGDAVGDLVFGPEHSLYVRLHFPNFGENLSIRNNPPLSLSLSLSGMRMICTFSLHF